MRKSIFRLSIPLLICGVLILVSIFAKNIFDGIQLTPQHLEGNNTAKAYININTADIDQFTLLPGIGETLANKIIAYRLEHGPFRSVEEIQNVPGIGPVLYEDISQFLTVGG